MRECDGVFHAPVGFIRVDSYLEIISRRFPHGQHPRRIRRHVSPRLHFTGPPAALVKTPRLAPRLIGRLDADPGVEAHLLLHGAAEQFIQRDAQVFRMEVRHSERQGALPAVETVAGLIHLPRNFARRPGVRADESGRELLLHRVCNLIAPKARISRHGFNVPYARAAVVRGHPNDDRGLNVVVVVRVLEKIPHRHVDTEHLDGFDLHVNPPLRGC